MGGRLSGRSFAGLYTSDLRRAFETAELIGSLIDRQPEPMTALREICLGEWEGLSPEQVTQRYPEAWANWVEEPDWDVVPGGEGAASFEARVAGALERISRRHPSGDVLVVTHGGVIQTALQRVVGRPSRGLFPFKIQNASITQIETREGRTVVGGVNDIAHLEAMMMSEPERS